MNILFCYRNYLNPNPGGAERVSDTLVEYFMRFGHTLYYLNFQYYETDNYKLPAKIFHLPDSDFFSKINLDYYHNLLKQLSIDIVFNHDSSNNRSKLWLNTGKIVVKKISLYHTDPLHGIYNPVDLSGYIKNPFLLKLISRNILGLTHYLKTIKKRREIDYLLKNSDRVVFLSEEFKNEIYKLLSINSSKILAINNPCISNTIKDLDIKKKQILFVARIDLPVKRPDKMLQIWNRIQNKFPDWELIFLGDGKDRLKVEKMAGLMKLNNVRFEGFVDPLPYYYDASVICMTSDYEGFGLVLVEAMQFGVVPITFNNWVSLKDIIKDQDTGILVSTDDIVEYSGKLEQLLSSDVIRKRISLNAKEYSKKFNIETIGPRWTELLNELTMETKL